MDDDPVLRALGAALERDDPRLAALLQVGPTAVVPRPPADTVPPDTVPADTVPAEPVTAAPEAAPEAEAGAGSEVRPAAGARRRPRWVRVLVSGLAVAFLLLVTIPLGLATFAAVGGVVLLASPVLACWWYSSADELRPPEG
ncbi:hypothetical protein [Geodermatophilus sp. URMC 64]